MFQIKRTIISQSQKKTAKQIFTSSEDIHGENEISLKSIIKSKKFNFLKTSNNNSSSAVSKIEENLNASIADKRSNKRYLEYLREIANSPTILKRATEVAKIRKLVSRGLLSHNRMVISSIFNRKNSHFHSFSTYSASYISMKRFFKTLEVDISELKKNKSRFYKFLYKYINGIKFLHVLNMYQTFRLDNYVFFWFFKIPKLKFFSKIISYIPIVRNKRSLSLYFSLSSIILYNFILNPSRQGIRKYSNIKRYIKKKLVRHEKR